MKGKFYFILLGTLTFFCDGFHPLKSIGVAAKGLNSEMVSLKTKPNGHFTASEH